MNRLPEDAGAGPAAVLAWFRRDFYGCLTARTDEIFELADAVLCADGPVRYMPLAIPSSGSPAPWPPICACPGNGPPRLGG